MKYALTFLVVVASLSSIADSTDLEYVCTPAKLRWPNVPSACRAFDLEVYHDRVYVGSGDYDNNAGPCYMLAVDPYYSACTNEFAAGTEATETIRTFSDGRLYVPATDHMDTGSYPNGFWFRKELDGTWGSHRGIPGGVTGQLNVHNWDMQEFDGWIFSGGYGIAGSSDWGEKWTDVAPKATLARGYTVYSAIMNGKPYDNTLLTLSSKYEYRFTAFLTVGDEFYCLPKNRYYFDQGYPKMPDGRTVSEWNPPTIWHWDKEKHVFNCESNSWENIAPGLQLEDFILVSSTAIPQEILVSGGSNYKVLDTWHATKFKDRCLYVISSTYRPIAAMCAYLDAGELRASRISLPAGTWPRDFTVFGDAAYLLAVAYDPANQSVRHTVWKSTDGITFTEILGFDFQQPMESIEYHEGYFYFGVGPKGALPNLGTLKKGIAELSGGIYRAWLPQEPVAVVADASTVQVQEGGSASVSLRLSAAPSATVEVTGSVLGTDLLSVEKKTLVFTPQNWNVPQTLSVSLPENDVSEPDAVKVVCGVATNGTRGAFASVEATPCVVTAVPVGNERAPVLADESFDTDHLPVSYTVSVSDFGLLNGVSPTSATVILSAYAEGSADPAVVAEKTVTTLNTPVTVAIDGIVKGAKYRFVAEVRTSSSVGTSSSVTARAPIGTAEELVDLTDDLTNYASKFGVNCHSGGADGTGAWDGTSSGYGKTFGGYSKPSCAIWEFVVPTVVNGMGLLSQISESGDPDRNPSNFGLYGANDTNNWVELVVCANEPQWAVGGEWRRVSFDNTTAYKFYKVALMGAQGPNSPWVVAQEAELYHLGGQPDVPPEMTYRFYHEELNIPAMHAKGITGRGVRVGVVDDGIYPVVIGGVTNLGFAALKGSPAAGYHGTSVSALIGSKEFGLAPDCEIWAYNSGNATGKTGLDQTIAGVWWCATNGCRVINMSFGFAPDMYDADLRTAFDAELAEIQRQTGVILINGNGNNPLSDINYCPQDSECVITIGGLKPDKTPAALTDSWRKDFCTFGDQVPDFVKPDGTIGTFDGTSCACPLATAIVALLLQQQPDLTQDEVYGILKSSAKVLAPGRTREYGWGLLQACEVPANYMRQAEYDAEKQAWVKLENVTITNKFVTYTASDNFYEITMRTGSVIRLMLSDPMPANATDKTVYWYCGNNHAGKPILTDQILRAPDEIATVTEITIGGQTIKLPTPNLENVYSYQGLNANYELLFNLRVRLTTDPVEIPENEDPNYVPADPERPERTDWSYYHESLNVPAMHAKGITGRGVRVGIVDGPINEVTVDGEKNLTIARLVGSGHGNGHGLSVASIIASKKFGIAPDCELYAYDVGNSTASDQVNKVLKGLWWCATNGCKVINMSFSFNPFQPGVAELRESFDAEIKKICDQTGVIMIASLGNNGLNDNPYFPQDTVYPICIGGITQDKQPTDLTKSWRHDFCAYGKQVPTFTKADGTVGNQDGTSFSAPMVTGVAALLLQQVPTLTRDELYGILKGSAEVLAEGLTREYGWGLVRACEVPSDYKRQSEYDAEKSAKVRLAGITINNQNGFYNPENGFFDMTVKVGTVVKIDYTPSPANATDKRAYWYAGNTQKLDPILADDILRARNDASLVGSFATYTAMNDDYEELVKMRVFFTDQDVGPEPEEPEEPVDPPSGDQSVVYVATTGSDSASGAFDAPLLTISNAVARLGATGGKIIVGPGTFEQKSPVVVTAAVEIVGAGCGLDGTVMKNVGKYTYGKIFRVLEMNHPQALLTGVVVSAGDIGAGSGIGGGGGILLTSGVVSNCVVRDCLARQASNPMPNGGGVYVHGENALLTHSIISNCVVSYDASWGSSICGAGVHVDGGCVEDTLVVGCHVGAAEPGASLVVGGIMLTDGTAENCTVVNCWGSKTGGICASPAKNKTVSVVNCVAFGCEKKLKDAEKVLQTTSSNGDGTASCFVNCSFDATASAFADYENGDYRPAAGGVLVDAGAAIADAPAGDLDGRPRVVGTAIDIGCFEWQEGGAVELEAPVLSGSSFGFSGTGSFSFTVANPVAGAYYTVFTTEDLLGTFVAESASVLCGGETLVLEMDASAPQKFAKIVVSTAPFAKGFELP